MAQMSEVLDIKGIAELMGISTHTIYRLATAGQIPALKLGGKWRFDRDTIKQWISRQMLKNCAR